MHQIKEYFSSLGPLTDAAWADIAAGLRSETLPKRAFLLYEGDVCDFVAFVQEGTFRFYHLKDGEEKVTAFFFSGDFVTNYRSFLTGSPSEHFIEAMSSAVIYRISRQTLDSLYDRHPCMERIGRHIAENVYLAVAKRLDSFLYATPEERYKELLARNSKLLHEVPQYMLASYLGVKPETLSRIRARR